MPKGLQRSLKRANPSDSSVLQYVRVPFNSVPLTVRGIVAEHASGGAPIPFAGLPKGFVSVVGFYGAVQFAKTDEEVIDTFSGSFGIGTAQEPLEQDSISAGSANIEFGSYTEAVGGTTPATGFNSTSSDFGKVLDLSAGAPSLFINMQVDAGDFTVDTDIQMLASGHLTLAYLLLGDR